MLLDWGSAGLLLELIECYPDAAGTLRSKCVGCSQEAPDQTHVA